MWLQDHPVGHRVPQRPIAAAAVKYSAQLLHNAADCRNYSRHKQGFHYSAQYALALLAAVHAPVLQCGSKITL
jgi:hypothetical protein